MDKINLMKDYFDLLNDIRAREEKYPVTDYIQQTKTEELYLVKLNFMDDFKKLGLERERLTIESCVENGKTYADVWLKLNAEA